MSRQRQIQEGIGKMDGLSCEGMVKDWSWEQIPKGWLEMHDSFCLVHFYIMLGWVMQTISAIFSMKFLLLKKKKKVAPVWIGDGEW